MDSLMGLTALKGALEAKLIGAKADPRFAKTRKGQTPQELSGQLPRGYAHLHKQGWVYWKEPGEVNAGGELVLFRPRTSEQRRFDATTWRVWEVKSERGQSEDAAEALHRDPDDAMVLHEIDELTIGLRTSRLLP
jgi:hypothetical protein